MRDLKVRCRAKTRTCRSCKHRFTKAEKDLDVCPICGEDRRCKQAAVRNYPVCTKHGAGSPYKGRPGGRPPKDGIFRHHLPDRMLKAYDQAYEDIRLTELRRDIALLEARRADLISRADSGESGHVWKEVKALWSEYRRAQRAQYEDPTFYEEIARKLDALIQRGTTDQAVWGEIEKITNELRKLRTDETKRLKDMEQMISVEKLFGLIGKVVGVIDQAVVDRRVKTEISMGITGLLEGSAIEGEFKEV